MPPKRMSTLGREGPEAAEDRSARTEGKRASVAQSTWPGHWAGAPGCVARNVVPWDRRMREAGPQTTARRRLDRRVLSREALTQGPTPKEPRRRPHPVPPGQASRRRHGRRASRRAGSVPERERERTC